MKKILFAWLVVVVLTSEIGYAINVKEIKTECIFDRENLIDNCLTVLEILNLDQNSTFKTNLYDSLVKKEAFSLDKQITNTIKFDKNIVWNKDRVIITGTVELGTSNYWGIYEIWNSTYWNSTFPYEIITHVNSTVGINLYNWTALIQFDAYNWEANGTLASNCSDLIMVWSDNTTELAFEIDDYCIGNRFWVKLPELASDNTTYFYIYIGNSTGILYENKPEAWNDYYTFSNRMNDNTTSTVSDSKFGYLGDKEAINNPVEITGKIINAQDFQENGDIDYGNLDVDDTPTITVSAWIKRDADSHSGALGGIIAKDMRGEPVADASFSFYVLNADNKPSFRVWATGDAIGTCSATVNDGSWNYLVGTYDSTSHVVRIYKDGSSCGTDDTITGNVNNADASLWVGDAYGLNANVFDGKIDEIRIASTNFSSDWIKMDYDIVQYNTGLVWFEGVRIFEEGEPEPEVNITNGTFISYSCVGNNSLRNVTIVDGENVSETLTYIICDNGCNENNIVITVFGNEANLCNPVLWLQSLFFIVVVVIILIIVNKALN